MTSNETPGQDDQTRPAVRPEEAQKPIGPSFAEPEERIKDLSNEILKVLTRAGNERITCRRVTGNHYRCNWWTPVATDRYDNPAMSGLTVTTHRISRSQFLHVTKTGDGIRITEAPRN